MGMTADLKVEQRRVRLGALSAFAITLAVYIAAFWLRETGPIGPGAISTVVCAMLAPALCVVAAVANVANRRYFSAADISGATTADHSPAIDIARAVLANTLEQAFLAVVLYAALALLWPAPGLLLAALATMFVIGRLCFALGYARGAGGRAFGFGLTFYPNALGLFGVAVLALS